MKTNFNEKYKEEQCYWGLSPSTIVKKLLTYIQQGDVLDIGVGEGRNALYLAKKGFHVTGIDISEEGIRKFLHLAKDFSVSVRAETIDITKYVFPQKFDVIMSLATLHFLKHNDIKEIIVKMKEHTVPHGLHVISVFTEENPYKRFPYLFKKGELCSFYQDWELLHYQERTTPLEQHGKDGAAHYHGIAILLAKNPA